MTAATMTARALLFLPITWKKVSDGVWRTTVYGCDCRLRLNDFPEEPLYSVQVGDDAIDIRGGAWDMDNRVGAGRVSNRSRVGARGEALHPAAELAAIAARMGETLLQALGLPDRGSAEDIVSAVTKLLDDLAAIDKGVPSRDALKERPEKRPPPTALSGDRDRSLTAPSGVLKSRPLETTRRAG